MILLVTRAVVECPSCGGTAVLLGTDEQQTAIYECVECDRQIVGDLD